MILSFVSWFLIITRITAQSERQEKLTADAVHSLRYCDFNDFEKDYDTTDLLQCINAIASDTFARQSGKSLRGIYRLPQSSYDESSNYFSLSNIVSSLFGNSGGSLYQFPSLSTDPVSSYYQSNYPAAQAGSSESSQGIRIDLFDALTSISRYDDLKCVPRILCEMASGTIPGGSIHKQTSSFLGNFGMNSLIGLLTNIDLSTTSPILHFGKATLLGYANRGHSETCYQVYPKCPRSSAGLIYYLNNHNGGFFRFFRDANRGTYSRPPYHPQSNAEYLTSGKEHVVRAPVVHGASSDRTGTGELKFDAGTPSQNNGQASFSEERIRNDAGKIVFPDERETKMHSPQNRKQKSFRDLRDPVMDDPSAENILSFPQDAYEDTNSLFLKDELSEESTKTKLRFPRDEELSNYRGPEFYVESSRSESSAIKFPDERVRNSQTSGFFPDETESLI